MGIRYHGADQVLASSGVNTGRKIEGTDRTWLSSSTASCFTRHVLWE